MTSPADYAVTLTTIICALIAGCAAGEIRTTVHDGETIIEHIDTTDQPPWCGRRAGDGCSQWRITDTGIMRHIWYASIDPGYVRRHELAHKTMHHTAWEFNAWYKANCATIIGGAPGYPLGHLLCNDGKKEWTIPPATAFAKE